MKLNRRHFTLLSMLGILIVINYILLQVYSDKQFVKFFDENLVENNASVGSILVLDTSTANTSTLKPKGEVSILHFGDAMFDRNVRKRMKNGVDPFTSLRSINIMNDYDIRMLNLEGPIVEMDRKKCQQKAYNFQFASNTAKMLKAEGFTSVTISNNHIYDCYKTGIASTQKYLNDAGIDIVGDIKPNKAYKIITTENGTKVVLIGIDTTINPYPSQAFYTEINSLKKENDVLIVTMHSGEEYLPKGNSAQIKLAHRLIDEGVDIVVGHHPHVVENMEVYKGRVIFYSLGNFIFDQIGVKENEGMGVGLKTSKDRISVELMPYNILNSVPTFKPRKEADNWCAEYFGTTSNFTKEGCTATIIK